MEGQYGEPNNDVIQNISRRLRQALGISLFGIDIIINNQTGQHAVIDINAFPGTCRSSQSSNISYLYALTSIPTFKIRNAIMQTDHMVSVRNNIEAFYCFVKLQ